MIKYYKTHAKLKVYICTDITHIGVDLFKTLYKKPKKLGLELISI